MNEKLGNIEEEISRLETDISQLLTRVENLRSYFRELKSEMATSPEPTVSEVEQVLNPSVSVDAEPMEQNSQIVEDDILITDETPVQYDSTDASILIDTVEPTVDSSDMTENATVEQPHDELPPIPPLAAMSCQTNSITPESSIYNDISETSSPQSDSDEQSNIEDLRKLFTINDRYRFRRELFGNDNIAMSDTINMISAMKSMSEVEDYVYSDLEWDKGNDDVHAFMDIITFYFMRKK